MPALNLPKPVNSYAGEDELRKSSQTNGANGAKEESNGDAAGEVGEDEGEYVAPKPSDRFKAGLIYPPREVRNIIDKTALAISKSPTPSLLEDKIRERQKNDAKFAFMLEEDPFHQYYRYMKERVAEDADAVRKEATSTQAVAEVTQAEDDVALAGGYEPKAAEFKVDLPGVTAHDLDILRLTALFHARRGRSFLSSLSIREGRNYQFDFLRPTHSLYGYYNRMVESYQKIMQPPPGMIESLVKETSDPELKWKTLEDARKRTEWERGRRKREDVQEKEKAAEAAAYSAIDWQDFVVVETIEFTQNDMDLELPPPTNVERLKSMSMAEKRMASMVMEETGAGPTGGDMLLPPGGAAQEEMEIEDEEEEEAKTLRIKAEQEQARAREVQTAALQSKGIKIKKDYVSKGINRTVDVQMGKCQYCGQSIPIDELSEHIRIELLDPKWKEQKRVLDMRRAQAQQLVQGADVSASLRNLAAQRTDLFGDETDEAARRQREEEANQKRREREKIIWDGHTASAAKTTDTFQSQFTLDEQIRKMHSQFGVSGEAPQNAAGPQAGPGIVPSGNQLPNHAALPPALAASLPKPAGGDAYAGATISAAPTGPTTREYISAPQPPSSASGPSVHPSRMAQMGSSPLPPPPMAGQVHARDDDADRPVFKRPKIEKLPYPQMYSEIDWQSLHPDPITLSVQLPDMPEKPEWKLNGSIITVPDLSVTFTFGTIRDRIKRVVDADLPISRLRLDYQGKVMSNAATLASVNLDDGDMIVMGVRKK